jgi:hypothetical protein
MKITKGVLLTRYENVRVWLSNVELNNITAINAAQQYVDNKYLLYLP